MKLLDLLAISSSLLLIGCVSPEKLTSKGWQLYRSGHYSKAESKFSNALTKERLTDALEGMAFVKYKYRNYSFAEKYIQEVYNRNKSSFNIYNYACFTNLNGNSSNAMRLLYELGNQSDFDTYRKRVSKSEDLNSLRNDVKFQRYLSGYRRLKISPYEAYSNDEDGLGFLSHDENELFITISNKNYLILSTKVKGSKDHVFFNDYVVFDYPLGTTVEMTLMDEDIYDHDKLVSVKGNFLDVGDFNFRGNGFMKIKIEDTEQRPYTTGLYVPSERNLLLDLLAVGGATYGLVNLPNLDASVIMRIINCAVQYGTTSDQATIVNEAVRKVIQNKGSLSNIGATAFTKYVVSELRANNQNELADIVQTGGFINCVLSN